MFRTASKLVKFQYCLTCKQQTFLKRLIMTTPKLDCERALETLQKNPYYEKYAQKIATLQETSPEEFLSRIEKTVKKKVPEKAPTNERSYSTLLNPKKESSHAEARKCESLESIMKIDLIHDKEPDEISSIWEEYHKQKDVIAAVIPAKEYDELTVKGKLYPTFLFPLPRSQGYEFMMLQFEYNSVHFTPLLYYQVHKDNAPECLVITHYTEFKESKGIVLMRGEYDKNILNAKEAQCLANQLKLFYTLNNEEKLNLMEVFTKKPDEFKHKDLIKQIENITL